MYVSKSSNSKICFCPWNVGYLKTDFLKIHSCIFQYILSPTFPKHTLLPQLLFKKGNIERKVTCSFFVTLKSIKINCTSRTESFTINFFVNWFSPAPVFCDVIMGNLTYSKLYKKQNGSQKNSKSKSKSKQAK